MAQVSGFTGHVGHRPDTYHVSTPPNTAVDTAFGVCLFWGDALKNLELIITDPNGVSHTIDNQGVFLQNYDQPGPLPSGQWTLEVVNTSSDSISYNLAVSFY